MQTFELLYKHLAWCGIKISQKPPNIYPFNVKNLAVSMLLCLYISSMSVLLDETSTFEEYTDTSFRAISIGSFGVIYEIIVWRTSKLLKFIESLSNVVKASELRNQIKIPNWVFNNILLMMLHSRTQAFEIASSLHRV